MPKVTTGGPSNAWEPEQEVVEAPVVVVPDVPAAPEPVAVEPTPEPVVEVVEPASPGPEPAPEVV